MSQRLQAKVAVVTGASSGLGRAIALAYAREGAVVVCADLDASAGALSLDQNALPTHELIVKDIPNSRSSFIKCDVSSAENVKQLVDDTVAEFGRLDIMVNNAGISLEARDTEWRLTHQTEVDAFDTTMAINARGVFLGCKYAIAQMLKQEKKFGEDRGWIINTASVLGLVGMAATVSYNASKGAVVQMTRTMGLEYGPERIHCNALCPGFSRTGILGRIYDDPGRVELLGRMHPLGGLGRPEDVAKAAVFLASDDCAWVTGVPLPVDGGYTAQ